MSPLSSTAEPEVEAPPSTSCARVWSTRLTAELGDAARRPPPAARRRPVGAGPHRRLAGRRPGRPRRARVRVLLLPVGPRLDAVAVRQGRGRPDRAAARALHRGRSRASPAARPASRCFARVVSPQRHVGHHAEGRRPRRHPDRRVVVERVRRRQLARARDVGDVRHHLRRPPRAHATSTCPASSRGIPLRKDFPLLARIVKPWPGIVDVEPMPRRRRGRRREAVSR